MTLFSQDRSDLSLCGAPQIALGLDDLGAEEQMDACTNLTPTKVISQFEVERTNDFKILSLNARSINNKFQGIRDLTHTVDPTVLCIQETWNTNPTTDYSIAGYHKPVLATRKMSGDCSNGGGTGIWVKNTLDYEIIKSKFECRKLETTAVHIIEHKMIICNVYRPPGDVKNALESIQSLISSLCEHKRKDIVIVGDFNVDLMQESISANKLLNATLEQNFIQLITTGTREHDSRATLIDHVYVNSKCSFETNVITSDLSDHYATLTTKVGNKVSNKKQRVTKRWFTPQAYDILSDLLEATDWSPIEDMTSEEAANHLELKIKDYSDIVAPVETKTVRTKRINQWLTQGLAISLKTSSKLYRDSKKAKTEQSKGKYKRYKKLLDKLIKKAKDSYYGKLIKDAGNDSRRLWMLINEVIDRKQLRQKIPSSFTNGENKVTDKKEISNLFNKYFASIGKKMAESQPDVDGYELHLKMASSKFHLRKVSKEEVEKIMAAQKPKLSCGIDTINNKLVKLCSKGLSVPMTKVINKSISEAKVPSAYKKARVMPLYKKGSPAEFGNYRPVSLLSALSKILEKVICKQMMNYLDHNNLLCPDQFGFRPKSQTNHVVQKMLNKISEEADKEKVTIATYLDLSKAFDCLQYDKLFLKLKYLGFQDGPMNWFKSYLSDRKQCIDLEGTISDWEDVQLGVPQGSILGPILFLIYINDVNNSDSEATFTKFADDTTVLISGNSIREATDKMNKSMINIDNWFSQNKLNLNPSKTRYMIFNPDRNDPDRNKTNLVKIGGEYLQRIWKGGQETAFKLVGVWIDEDLKWKSHIENVTKKVNSAIYGLNKTGKSLDIKNKRLLYMGLIQSHLVFGSPFWGLAKKTRLKPLVTAQKRAIRRIHNLKYRDHTNDYFKRSNLLKLDELVKYSTLTYVHSSIMVDSPSNIASLWKTKPHNPVLRDRGQQLLRSKSNKQWIQDLPPNKQVKIWNECPIDPKNKRNKYKNDLKTYYLNQY